MTLKIAGDVIDADNAARIADLKSDYEHLGAQLSRRGIAIDAIKANSP
jgi:L-rhamnose isomerase / sugar isomerase